MSRRVAKIAARFVLCFLALAVVGGCGASREKREPKITWRPSKAAVAPFTALGRDDSSSSVRSPLTGATFIADGEPIPAQVTSYLNSLLLENLSKNTSLNLVPPTIAGPLVNRMRGANMGAPLARVLAQAGSKLGAQGVVVGYVYRWQDRVGGAFTAQRPASVAFDVAMLRVEDGAVLWKNSFDHTQMPLSENILNADLYAEEGIRWLTAQDLARYGMGVLMRRFPWAAVSEK